MRVAILIVIAAILTYAAYATTISGSLSVLNQLISKNNRIYVATIATHDAEGIRSDGTGAVGTDVTKAPMFADSAMRGNFQFDHLLLSIVVQSFITRQILSGADSSISSSLLPRGVTLVNPAYTSTPLTLRQLLTHTSTLLTSSAFDTSPSSSGGSNAVTDLVSFCDYYTVSNTGGTYTQATNIWAMGATPGTAAAYSPSRANTVLLAYIVQQVITNRPSLVSSAQKTVGAYVQEFVINGMGLSSTYFLLPTGQVPYVELGLTSFSGSKVAEHTSSGLAATSIPIHPATIGSGVMLITSASDISKVMYKLFIQGTGAFAAIGASLENSLVEVTGLSSQGITHLGFGINKYSASLVCALAANAISMSNGCSINSSPFMIGFGSTGTNSVTGAMCTDYSSYATGLVTTNSKRICTATAIATNPTGGSLTAAATVLPIAAGVANEAFIDPALTEGSTITEDSQKRTWDYGLLTFAYIVIILIAIFAIAYLSEYYVQPMPIVGHLSANAYPTLEEHMSKAISRR